MTVPRVGGCLSSSAAIRPGEAHSNLAASECGSNTSNGGGPTAVDAHRVRARLILRHGHICDSFSSRHKPKLLGYRYRSRSRRGVSSSASPDLLVLCMLIVLCERRVRLVLRPLNYLNGTLARSTQLACIASIMFLNKILLVRNFLEATETEAFLRVRCMWHRTSCLLPNQT